MSYRLSQKAQDEIIDIYLYGIEHYNEQQADNYHTSLSATFGILAQNPELARERTELHPPVRVHPHGSHLIIYRVETNRDIFIISIRHAREDWQDDP